VNKPPETWFWSHDIKPNQIDSVLMPGTRLARLSSYGVGAGRRFAALVYKEPGPERSYALDLDVQALAARLRDGGARPVAITASAAEDDPARFSLVLETGPGPLSSAHVDLDEAGVRSLIDDQHCIADLATYTSGDERKFAVIIEERAGRSSSTPRWCGCAATSTPAGRGSSPSRCARGSAAGRGTPISTAMPWPVTSRATPPTRPISTPSGTIAACASPWSCTETAEARGRPPAGIRVETGEVDPMCSHSEPWVPVERASAWAHEGASGQPISGRSDCQVACWQGGLTTLASHASIVRPGLSAA
jgi:hypothetical protein